MRLANWYANADISRHLAAAQMYIWFAGAAPVFVGTFIFAEIALGHPGDVDRLVISPQEIVGGALWLAACIASGILIGARRASGIYLGAILSSAAIVASVSQARVFAAGVAGGLLGIVLLMRAWHSLRA